MEKVLFLWRYNRNLYIYETSKKFYETVIVPGYNGGGCKLRFRKFNCLDESHPSAPGEIISDGEAVFLIMKYEMEKVSNGQ